MRPLLFLIALVLAGCLHPVKRVEKQCFNPRKGEPLCRCRDVETGRFIPCK